MSADHRYPTHPRCATCDALVPRPDRAPSCGTCGRWFCSPRCLVAHGEAIHMDDMDDGEATGG